MPNHFVRGVIFSPDGQRLVITYQDKLSVWDVKTGKLIASHTDPKHEFDHERNMERRPMFLGDRLITIHHTGATLWQLNTATSIMDFPSPRTRRTSFRLRAGNTQLLTFSPGNDGTIWDINTGKKLHSITNVPGDLMFGLDRLRFSADERQLFASHRNGEALTVWNSEKGWSATRHYLLDKGLRWLTKPNCEMDILE